MFTISKSKYEEIQNCNFYKKYLGHNMHLCTCFGVANNKNAPLWKRFLSHIPVIIFAKITELEE